MYCDDDSYNNSHCVNLYHRVNQIKVKGVNVSQ